MRAGPIVLILSVVCLVFAPSGAALAQDCQASVNVTYSNLEGGLQQIIGSISLNSSDRNEDGEGEYLTLNSNSAKVGCPATSLITNHNSAVPFSCTWVAGEDPNPAQIFGTIHNRDGDESCTIIASQAPDWWVLGWKQWCQSNDLNLGGAAFVSGGVGTITTGALSTIAPPAAVLSLFLGGWGLVCAAIAHDPPANYTLLAKPNVPDVPAITGLPPAVDNAFEGLAKNEAAIVGFGQAFAVTLNRAFSADAAGATDALNRQISEAKWLGGNIDMFLDREILLRHATASALTNAGLDGIVTADQLAQYENEIAIAGLPSQTIQFLQKAGFSQADIIALTNLLIVQDVNSLAGSYSAVLYNSGVATALKKAAGVLGGACYGVYVVGASLGSHQGQILYSAAADLNHDGVVDNTDLSIAFGQLPGGTICPGSTTL